MSDIGQILLLPPPAPLPQRLPARENELAVSAEAQGAAAARAKRFHFRVYEGGESSETNTELAARRTDRRAALTGGNGSTDDATGQSSSPRIRYASTGDSRSGASSAFLAQAFAQEQLGEGLHNPPFAAATSAYSRSGAALNTRASAGIDIRA